ncbi:uncharacterized protein [Physcomitrium patens]|uniref:Uncharacterized protein n=1 Tax=Physcomitrium patens TaxID=3218 RepID=A0A2K1L180_PHYPA|nr:uncharacterized protein At5g65660-like [Physcomitrium patens]PNR59788.1 hypothetical protein PHYPA_002580 [Physcomitrium patens]|eukprot:XP_024365761.1 uncharacterized protein At5g65660-like [Physcomitrella patens]
MEAQFASFEWKSLSVEGKALQATHAPPPLMNPSPPKYSRTNFALVSGLAILIVMAVGAILCCCYQWEVQLRLQSRARSVRHSTELLDDMPSSSPSNSFQDSVDSRSTNDPPRVISMSVIMPGDDFPRFVAWVVP